MTPGHSHRQQMQILLDRGGMVWKWDSLYLNPGSESPHGYITSRPDRCPLLYRNGCQRKR